MRNPRRPRFGVNWTDGAEGAIPNLHLLGDDHEDLTDRVRAEVVDLEQERGIRNFGFDDDEREPVTVRVSCLKGHRNEFDL